MLKPLQARVKVYLMCSCLFFGSGLVSSVACSHTESQMCWCEIDKVTIQRFLCQSAYPRAHLAAMQGRCADVLLRPGSVHGGVPAGRGRQGQALLDAQRAHHDPPAPRRRQRPGCGHRDPGEPFQPTSFTSAFSHTSYLPTFWSGCWSVLAVRLRTFVCHAYRSLMLKVCRQQQMDSHFLPKQPVS